MKKKKSRALKGKLRRKLLFGDSSSNLNTVIQQKALYLPKDILLNALIPFISYWELEDFLKALHFSPRGIYILMMRISIARVKYTEHQYDIDDYCGIYEEYTIDGVHHCEHSPAYVYRNLSGYSIKKWYLKGQLHRRDGPAIRIKDPYNGWVKKYYIHGELHREDGPAWDAEFGPPKWYRNGVEYNPLLERR